MSSLSVGRRSRRARAGCVVSLKSTAGAAKPRRQAAAGPKPDRGPSCSSSSRARAVPRACAQAAPSLRSRSGAAGVLGGLGGGACVASSRRRSGSSRRAGSGAAARPLGAAGGLRARRVLGGRLDRRAPRARLDGSRSELGLGLLEHVRLRALEPGRRLGVARLHAQHAAPRVGGLARIGELLLPHARDLARELGARAHVLAAEDLVLVELHHPAVVAELRQQRRRARPSPPGRWARGRAASSGRRRRPPCRSSCSRRSFARRARSWRTSGPSKTSSSARESVASARRGSPTSLGERLERVERERVDVGDERVAEPARTPARRRSRSRCAIERRAPQERAARAAAVARSLAAVAIERSQSARRSSSPPVASSPSRAASSRTAASRPSGAAAERELEEAARALDLPAWPPRPARRARARDTRSAGALAARDLALVEVDDVARASRRCAARRSSSSSASPGGTLVSPASPCWSASARGAPALTRDLGLAHELPGALGARAARAPGDRARSTARRGRSS